MLSMLGNIFSRRHFEILSYFSQNKGFVVSYKWSSVCRKCQNLASGKNKKNINRLSSAELPREL